MEKGESRGTSTGRLARSRSAARSPREAVFQTECQVNVDNSWDARHT